MNSIRNDGNSSAAPNSNVRPRAELEAELAQAEAKLAAWQRGAAPDAQAPMQLTNHVYLLKKALQVADAQVAQNQATQKK